MAELFGVEKQRVGGLPAAPAPIDGQRLYAGKGGKIGQKQTVGTGSINKRSPGKRKRRY